MGLNNGVIDSQGGLFRMSNYDRQREGKWTLREVGIERPIEDEEEVLGRFLSGGDLSKKTGEETRESRTVVYIEIIVPRIPTLSPRNT